MPRSSLVFGIGCLSLAGCLINPYGFSIKGSGVKTIETKRIHDFRELSGQGVGTYKVTSGKPASLKITTDDNLQPYIQYALDTKGAQLHIRIKEGNYDWTLIPEMEVETSALESVHLRGKITLDASGIDAKKFTVKIEGQNNVILSGSVEELTVQINGRSDLNAAALKCKKVKIICNGNCSASIHGTESVDVEAHGMCGVDVLGKPATKNFKINDMSVVNEK